MDHIYLQPLYLLSSIYYRLWLIFFFYIYISTYLQTKFHITVCFKALYEYFHPFWPYSCHALIFLFHVICLLLLLEFVFLILRTALVLERTQHRLRDQVLRYDRGRGLMQEEFLQLRNSQAKNTVYSKNVWWGGVCVCVQGIVNYNSRVYYLCEQCRTCSVWFCLKEQHPETETITADARHWFSFPPAVLGDLGRGLHPQLHWDTHCLHKQAESRAVVSPCSSQNHRTVGVGRGLQSNGPLLSLASVSSHRISCRSAGFIPSLSVRYSSSFSSLFFFLCVCVGFFFQEFAGRKDEPEIKEVA